MSSTRRKIVVRDASPEISEYRARITAAGGTISQAAINALVQFVADCQTAGLWSKLYDVGPLAGDQLAAALVKLKHPAGVQPVLTNFNFVSGDYTQATGLNGNGTTKHLATGVYQPEEYGHLSFYARAAAPSGPRTMIGNDQCRLGFEFGNANALRWGTTSPDAPAFSAGMNEAGFYLGQAPGYNARELWFNGTNYAAVSATATGGGEEHLVFADNTIGPGAANFWSGSGAFYSIGQPLAEQEIIALTAAVQALQTALGRAV